MHSQKPGEQRKRPDLKSLVLNILTLGAYGTRKNYTRAKALYEKFIKAADTDGDGFVSLTDQERYLSEHGIELDTITLPDGTRAVRSISVFEGGCSVDPAGKYSNAHPAVNRELDNIENKLFTD